MGRGDPEEAITSGLILLALVGPGLMSRVPELPVAQYGFPLGTAQESAPPWRAAGRAITIPSIMSCSKPGGASTCERPISRLEPS